MELPRIHGRSAIGRATTVAALIAILGCHPKIHVTGRVTDEERNELSDCIIFMVTEAEKEIVFARNPQFDNVPSKRIGGRFSVTWDTPREPVLIGITCGEDLAWYVTASLPPDKLRRQRVLDLGDVALRRRVKVIKEKD